MTQALNSWMHQLKAQPLATLGFSAAPILVDQIVHRIFSHRLSPKIHYLSEIACSAVALALSPRSLRSTTLFFYAVYKALHLYWCHRNTQALMETVEEMMKNKIMATKITKCLTQHPHLLKSTHNGLTLLHMAVLHSRSGIVEWLLENAPHLRTAVDQEGQTPLHLAAQKPNYQIAKALWTQAPRLLEVEDSQGRTPLSIRTDTGDNLLHRAISEEQFEDVQFLLGTRPDLTSIVNQDGQTPLHLAVCTGHEEMITYVCEFDHDALLIQNNNGCFPHELATKPAIAQELKKAHKQLKNRKTDDDIQ